MWLIFSVGFYADYLELTKTHDFEDVDNNGKWVESYNGDGGFHQVFVGLGYKVFNNLSVGANFSYLYGDITHQSLSLIHI